MPATGRSDDLADGSSTRLSVKQRLLLGLPRFKPAREKAPLGTRLKDAMLKPADPEKTAKSKASEKELSVEELEAASKSADDKERLVGLMAAPFAAAIGILVISALVSNDPPAFLKDGQPNKLHVSISLYHDLTLVLLGLALLMLVTAWFRKRLYLGMIMALYGLAIFNLHYWGFGIPFILCAAWLLVRSYRIQRDLKAATGGSPSAGSRAGSRGNEPQRPHQSKRYTPPAPAARRPVASRTSKAGKTDQKKAV